jgi:hypothetical protein
MYIYKAWNIEPIHVVNEKFSTLEEVRQFADANKDKHTNVKIDILEADGKIENEEEKDMDSAYDEEAELDRMGLNDEETAEGFDWTFEDKGGE